MKRNTSLVCIFSDVHFDNEHPGAWAAFRQWHAEYRPELTIANGDIVDLGMLSRYEQSAEDPVFARLTQFFAGVVTFAQPAPLSGSLAVAVVLGALLVAYIPLSRMAHFVAKYFLYHDVRWSDEANERGSAIEGKIKQAFGYRVEWNAPHIQTGKSWGEVGTKTPEDSQ